MQPITRLPKVKSEGQHLSPLECHSVSLSDRFQTCRRILLPISSGSNSQIVLGLFDPSGVTSQKTCNSRYVAVVILNISCQKVLGMIFKEDIQREGKPAVGKRHFPQDTTCSDTDLYSTSISKSVCYWIRQNVSTQDSNTWHSHNNLPLATPLVTRWQTDSSNVEQKDLSTFISKCPNDSPPM
jgi:hypothetical protein